MIFNIMPRGPVFEMVVRSQLVVFQQLHKHIEFYLAIQKKIPLHSFMLESKKIKFLGKKEIEVP